MYVFKNGVFSKAGPWTMIHLGKFVKMQIPQTLP